MDSGTRLSSSSGTSGSLGRAGPALARGVQIWAPSDLPGAARRGCVENPAVRLATFADAAGPADVVVNATSGTATLEVLGRAGDLAGKVLLDVSNGLDFSRGFPPLLTAPQDDSIAELMAHPDRLPDPGTVFLSGDDADAKATVAYLLAELGHTDVLDLGDVSTARGVEWLMPAWLRLVGVVGSPMFNWKVVR